MSARASRPLRQRTLISLVLAGCAGQRADSAAVTPPPAPAGSAEAAKVGFENPGGMWMPTQMAEHAATLRSLGVAFDPASLTDPTAFPLGAIVHLGGCSASFVSPEGLVVTNHHCVTGILQYNSTPEANLLENGYVAKTRADEKWAGPTQRVYVTTGFTDVTDKVRAGLETLADPKARYAEIEKRTKELTGACERGRVGTRCRVASYFEGAQFYQIEQIEIRDVRLVYAPHEGVGVFGGEIDNWRWPRHTGDWAFLRAYVGKDGQPADHSADNVPYRPKHVLPVSKTPLREGDFTMVTGYPGRTYRLRTAGEVKDATEWSYPRRIALNEQYIALLEGVSKDAPELQIKVASRLRGLNNQLTNNRGMLDGLGKGGLLAQKQALESDLERWIAADPERKRKFDGVLEGMEAELATARATRDRDAAIGEILGGSALLQVADTIIEMAEQRPKPDAERRSGYQDRDFPRLVQGTRAMQRQYDPSIDRAVLEMFVVRAAALPEGQRPTEVLAQIVPGKSLEPAAIDKALDRLYAKTRLGDEESRVKLLEKADAKALKRSSDPFIKLALSLRPLRERLRQEQEARDGQLAMLRPRYVEALRESNPGPLAPDANSTLRITYGTVRGYRPTPDAAPYRPFTTLTELVAKHTGEKPFDAPDAFLAAARERKFGPYADAALGDLPVDFLSDLHITGGNSGSATINARGEFVGLAFDGNYEAMASDWLFIPAITRTIHVDARYMLWTMDAVDGADHLIREMGHAPAIPDGATAPAAKP